MRKIGRRMFLRGLGGATLGLPFLSSLLPAREARAQAAAGPPKRFIALLSFSAMQYANNWLPTATPGGYRLRAVGDNGDDPAKADGTTFLPSTIAGTSFGTAPMSDFASTGFSNVLPSSLSQHYEKLLVLRGIDYLQYTSHNYGCMLGNYADCSQSAVYDVVPPEVTIDQVLAYSSKFYPQSPTLRSLHVGTGFNNTFSATNYGIAGGAVEAMPMLRDPRAAWDAAFGNFTPPGDEPQVNPNLLLVDRVHQDYARLKDHRRLSAVDRTLLDRHMTFLFELQQRLNTVTTLQCVPPAEPASISSSEQNAGNTVDIVTAVDLFIDIAVAALLCDVTRIVTFKHEVGIYNDGATVAGASGIHSSGDVPGDWHYFAHSAGDPDADAHALEINQWIANNVFARFIERLDVDEGDGTTVLDNSLLYWGNELGIEHYVQNIPTMLAGGAGGRINTGRYVDYSKWDGDYANDGVRAADGTNMGLLIPGLPHNRLLVTIMQAMGLSPSDYEKNGLPGYGDRSQAGGTPFAWPDDAYDFNAIGEPLPGLLIDS